MKLPARLQATFDQDAARRNAMRVCFSTVRRKPKPVILTQRQTGLELVKTFLSFRKIDERGLSPLARQQDHMVQRRHNPRDIIRKAIKWVWRQMHRGNKSGPPWAWPARSHSRPAVPARTCSYSTARHNQTFLLASTQLKRSCQSTTTSRVTHKIYFLIIFFFWLQVFSM